MASRRVERVNEQLKRELTDVVHTGVRDPRIGRVTITEVRTAPDLHQARVFVTGIGTVEERRESLDGLRAAAGWIRGELGRRLRIRRVPELSFEWDAALEHAKRIEELLDEVRPHGEDVPPRGGDESRRAGEDVRDAGE